MKLLVALGLLAVALAALQPSHREFTPGKQYEYEWRGQIATGVPVKGSSSHSVQQISAKVIITVEQKNWWLRLDEVSVLSGESRLAEPRVFSKQMFDESPLTEEQKEQLQMPVRFRYHNGIVAEVHFAERDNAWSENVKRAVLNMLQINVSPRNIEMQTEGENKFFTAPERMLEGECEVAYTFNKNEKETEVTKSINFEKCVKRVDIRYGLRYSAECPACETQDARPESQTVITYKINGDNERFLINEVEIKSDYVFTPLNKEHEMLATYVHNIMRLTKVSEAEKIEEPRMGKKSTLMYNYEIELAREQFWMTGDEQAWKEAGFDKLNKVELVEKTFATLVREMEKKETQGLHPEATHLMSRIVEVLRMCKKSEMRAIHEKVCQNEQRDESKKRFVQEIINEALAIAGTKVTVEHLIETIEESKHESFALKAALTLKNLVNVRVPSEKIVQLLVRLAKSGLAREHPVLRQTALLTSGALMNGLCSENKDMWAVEIEGEKRCTREQKDSFLRELENIYENAASSYEKVLVLKTIANSGIDLSIHFLQDIIYSKREEQVVRLSAVDALRMLREVMPRKVQSVLMPLFKSRQEKPALRMSAVYQIVHSQPARSLLDQIVEQLNKESNLHVRSFTYSLLKSFTETENPCEKQLSEDIKVALRMLRNKPAAGSTHIHLPAYSKLFNTAVSFDYAEIFSNESMLPEELLTSFDSLFAGQWNKQLLQFGFSQQNLDALIRPLLNKLEQFDSEVVVRGMRSSKQPMKEMLRELVNKMKIVTRRSGEERDQFGMLYIRYKNLDYAVLPLEQDLIEKYIRNGELSQEMLTRLISKLAQGIHFETTMSSFGYEYTRTIPTTIGLPLTVSQKLPTVASVKGFVQLSIAPKFQLRLTAQPSIVSTHVCSMQTFAPFTHTGARVLHTVHATLPIDSTVEFNNEKKQLKTTIKLPKTQQRLLLLDSRPVTIVRKINEKGMPLLEEKTIVIPKFEKTSVHYDKSYGSELTGFETRVLGSIHRHVYEKQSPESVLFGENHVQVNMVPTEKMIEEVVIEVEPRLTIDREMENPRYDEDFTKDEFRLEDSEENEYELEGERSLRHKESRNYYKSLKLGQSFESRIVAKIYTKGGPNGELKGHADIKTSCEHDLRFCKMEMIAKRSPIFASEEREWELVCNAEIVMPESPKSLKQLREQKHREIQAKVSMKWGAEERNELNVQIQGEQDRQMQKLVKEIGFEKQGLVESDKLHEVARLNKFSMLVRHDLTKKNEKLFEHIYDIVKAYYFIESEVTPLRRQQKTLLVKMVVEPLEGRRVNFTVETPEERFEVSDLYSPVRVPTLSIAQKQVLRKLSKVGRAECEVRSNSVNTFDNLLYKVPLTTCYSVIAKDCSEEVEYAVMIKKLSGDSEEKKLMIVTAEKKIEIELVDEKLRCKVNGKVVDDEEILREHGITFQSESVCEVELRLVSVHFDGFQAQIKADRRTQNTMCGLCGHFDDERNNEFRRADNEETEDIKEFHRSWLSKDNECEIEEEKLKKNENYRIASEEQLYEDDEESSEQQLSKHIKKNTLRNYNNEQNTYEPERKTIVIEREHKICFSTQEEPACKSGDEIVSSETRKVNMVCLPRSGSIARRLLAELRREGSIDIDTAKRTGDNFVDKLRVPTVCRAY